MRISESHYKESVHSQYYNLQHYKTLQYSSIVIQGYEKYDFRNCDFNSYFVNIGFYCTKTLLPRSRREATEGPQCIKLGPNQLSACHPLCFNTGTNIVRTHEKVGRAGWRRTVAVDAPLEGPPIATRCNYRQTYSGWPESKHGEFSLFPLHSQTTNFLIHLPNKMQLNTILRNMW